MGKRSFEFNKELIQQSKWAKSQDFHNLMRFKIRDILLVSSLYDSYIFEEEGRLYELIREEYQGLNLNNPPELVQVANGEEAIELAMVENRFNLIIITMHIEDMSAVTFAKKIKSLNIHVPVILLGYDNKELADLLKTDQVKYFENIFMWQGDFRIILGIVKYLEDKYNVENDIFQVGVQAVILVEDSVRFYSSYLPLIYTEILKQSHNLILHEGINLSHKVLRMRARPKILLCHTFEEAMDYYERYEDNVLGIVSDVDFFRNGESDKIAGVKLAKAVKESRPDIPILLQSNDYTNKERAEKIDVAFLHKKSPTLNKDLRHFIKNNFSFGDFIFKTEEGGIVGTARTLKELEKILARIPQESILYHAKRNDFSTWLKARTEFWLANQLRPKRISDYENIEELRDYLIETIRNFRKARHRSVITDFDISQYDSRGSIMKIGDGSIGGKTRGLGFVNNLLYNFDVRKKFPNVEIFVPSAAVLSTDVFDKFLEENNLLNFALHTEDDKELTARFLAAEKFPYEAVKELSVFLEKVHSPLAVRSSSLLEDSQGQPFAGVYETYMVPNNHPNPEIRLFQLINMVKLVYASTFSKKTKDYIKVTSYRLEEEKMAVLIQKTVGASHGNKYYPEFSGVAKSYNFYPTAPMTSQDGIVYIACGLGKTIVEGGKGVRFCPKYPNNRLQFATVNDVLKYSQKKYFGLLLDKVDDHFVSEDVSVKEFDIQEAVEEGTMTYTGSTYSHENNVIYDGVSREGLKLFTMTPILKYNNFPLTDILNLLLKMGSWGMSSPVEIEFAVNLSVPEGRSYEFGILQMRPLVINNELEELELEIYNDDELIVKSENVLGNGVVDDIFDIVYVDINKYDRGKSREVSAEIECFNSKLIHENKHYLLIGVGRWGTLDPWLGIPVTWDQISGAKAIVEANFKDFSVTPSQGSHFFQNLTSFKIGYFTVDPNIDNGFVDWEWLGQQSVVEEREYTRHVRLKEPVSIKINGQESRGIIVKNNGKK